MKLTINTIDNFHVTPENEAEKALLVLWKNKNIRCYSCGDDPMLTFQFTFNLTNPTNE